MPDYSFQNATASFVKNGAVDTFSVVEFKDTLEVKSRSENKQQAEAKAKSALHKANSQECTGSMSMPGSTLIIAGNNFELTGMGKMSGINHIISSTHTIDRSGGYVTSCEVKRVSKIAASKHKPKAKKTSKDGTTAGQNPSVDFSWQNATTTFTNNGALNIFNP